MQLISISAPTDIMICTTLVAMAKSKEHATITVKVGDSIVALITVLYGKCRRS